MIVHEIFRFLKKDKSNNHHIAIKLDLTKVYDRVECQMIFNMMEQVGFNQGRIRWIKECMSLVSFKALINGSPGKSFTPTRGLRQSDPMSSFLFLLCAEGVSASLIYLERINQISRIKINGSCIVISHLLFADNCYIFFPKSILTRLIV